MPRTCSHPDGHISGQLRRDRGTGQLTAWLVCDDCGETVRFLPDQTGELRRQTSAAAAAATAAAAPAAA